MDIEIQLTPDPIPELAPPPPSGTVGAWVEFRGVVRAEENGRPISALEYEAYEPMAEWEIHRLLLALEERHACLAVRVIHRLGTIPVGATAIYVGVAAKHRGPAFALMMAFMDRLKQDVPVWKRRAITPSPGQATLTQNGKVPAIPPAPLSLDDVLTLIRSRARPLPAVRVTLEEAADRVLAEDIHAREDSPAADRSTRDGYAVLRDDPSEFFSVVDTLHAADWRPRQIHLGEAVRLATGTPLPSPNLRVVMQEQVERQGDRIKILRQDGFSYVSARGEDWRAGDRLLPRGGRLTPGALAILASVGQTRPLVCPTLNVLHLTTGDEIVPPTQTPEPGQIRDSNSILIRTLLAPWGGKPTHHHLPENFEAAKRAIEAMNLSSSAFNLVLVSGGASVGDKDFSRPLLEWLGFEIVLHRVNLRPGAPLMFGADGLRLAFGLPGNPLSHFVCFHLFVAAALAHLTGAEPHQFLTGALAGKLEDAPNPRDTLWPARLAGGGRLMPLRWANSGNVACLAETQALILVPAGSRPQPAGAPVRFLPVGFALQSP